MIQPQESPRHNRKRKPVKNSSRAIVSLLAVASLVCSGTAMAAPAVTVENVNVARPDIKIWNVKTTSPQREGSTTSNESGKLNIKWKDGTTTSHDAKFKNTSATLFQDGEICHNYGKQCYCGTTTYRLESGMSKWKFSVPSNNKPVDCPSGIQPTNDADIKKSMSKEEMRAAAEEKRRQIQEERRARAGH